MPGPVLDSDWVRKEKYCKLRENDNVIKIQNKSINLEMSTVRFRIKFQKTNWHVQKRTTGNNLNKHKQIYF